MEIKPITKGILMLTTGCNRACEYCFENHAHPRRMTFETAKRALDYMQSNCKDGQKVRLTFFGGEPLLMFDSIIVPLVSVRYGCPMRRAGATITCSILRVRICTLHECDVAPSTAGVEPTCRGIGPLFTHSASRSAASTSATEERLSFQAATHTCM